MATTGFGNGRPTMLDIAKRLDPSGKIADIVEVLQESNAIIQDAPSYESNATMGNRVTLRSSLPTIGFTRINEGIKPTKSTTKQVVDSMGILGGRSEVDLKQKIALGGEANFNAYRLSEDDAFLEKFGQVAAYNVLYGNEASDSTAFTGFMARLGALSNATVVSGGSSDTDNCSILCIDWHERYCHLIHPQGTQIGLQSRDLGEQSVEDGITTGAKFQAMVQAYDWALGLTVKSPKHIGRIANIEVSALATVSGMNYAGPNLTHKVIDLLGKMDPQGAGTRVLYMPSVVLSAFQKLALDKSNVNLGTGEWAGQPVTTFQGIPMRRVDQMLLNEQLVS